MSDSATVVGNIVRACDELGEVELAGIKLETADPRLLDVSQMDLDQHVSMQPGAIAFYGAMLKDAGRRLAAMRRHYERWEKKAYALAKASLASGTGKSTVNDVEARFIVDNESELEKWDRQLDKLQEEYDTLYVWFEAWRQKSFSIREHANITEEERFNEHAAIRGDGAHGASARRIEGQVEKDSSRAEGMNKIRAIIKKGQGAGAPGEGKSKA